MAYLMQDAGVEVSLRRRQSLATAHTDAYVGTLVWDSLGLPASPNMRIAISLQRTSSSNISETVDCWAKRGAEPEGVSLSSSLLDSLSIHLLKEEDVIKPWIACLSRPQPFATVFMKAVCREDYESACAHSEHFEAWMSREQRILRRGSTIRIPGAVMDSTADSCGFELVMTEPGIVGFLDPASTRIVLTASDTLRSPNHSVVEQDIAAATSPVEELVIGEDFLAASLLSPEFPSTGLSSPVADGSSSESAVYLRLDSLVTPISSADGHAVYLRIGDLNRLGVLSGDWAVARLAGSQQERLVQVCAHTDCVPTTGTCMTSPILAYNLALGCLKNTDPVHCPEVALRPLGSAYFAPVAQSVTLARVAAPLTTLKLYEQSLMRALRRQLSSSLHAVAEGDVICVGLDAGSSMRHGMIRSGNDDLWEEPSSSSVPYDAVAYYQVTELQVTLPPVNGFLTGMKTLAWIEPTKTTLVQVGATNITTPDVAAYMGIGLTRQSRTPVTSDTEKALHSLMAAMSQSHLSGLDLRLPILLKGMSGVGKFTVILNVARRLGLNVQETNCYSVVGDTDTATEAALRVHFERAAACSPCVLVLRGLDAFNQSTSPEDAAQVSSVMAAVQDCLDEVARSTRAVVIVVGTTDNPDRLPAATLAMFKHDIILVAPTEPERLHVLASKTSNSRVSADVSLPVIATRSAALIASDLLDLVTRSEALSAKRSLKFGLPALIDEDLSIQMADYDEALSRARKAYSESIGAPKIPNVSWDDVGGLARVKAEVLDTIQLPLDHPELFGGGLKKRSGVLLYGPPGTGKTLVAKAVATSCSLNFLSVKGPELLNMYIGESEANVRRIFQRARDAKPCVIFFDELDSVAPKRGNQGDSGGVMDRIVSQLLAELDGVAGGSAADIFVIGATNRPDLLDPALLRPGRFDRMLYLGLSDTHDAQLQLLQALTRKFRLHPDLDLRAVAEQCPLNLTGADFYALCADAMLKAMVGKIQHIDDVVEAWNAQPHSAHGDHPHPMTARYYLSELASLKDMEVQVTQDNFILALQDLVPSVSVAELEHYHRIQGQYSNN